jgi:hypothetical protein
MRVPRPQFTLRRLMTAIALCAVSLAVVRAAPAIVIVFGPLVGSLLDWRKGGKGLAGGTIGGMITAVAAGLFFFVHDYFRSRAVGLASISRHRFVAVCRCIRRFGRFNHRVLHGCCLLVYPLPGNPA